MKQTAVDFLYEFILLQLTNEQQAQFEGLFQQAKQMEKEQIIDAWKNGDNEFDEVANTFSEKYYNETFKSE